MKTKTIKTIFLTLVWIMQTSILLLAQQHGHKHGPPPVPDSAQIVRMVTKLKSELNLSEQQTNQLNELFHDHFKEVRKKSDEVKTMKGQAREEMEKLRFSFEKKVNGILTPDQQKKFKEFQKNHKDRPVGPPAKKE